MNEDIVISVRNVTKTYRLYRTHADRVKEAFHPFRKKYHRPFNALSHISFDIRRGEPLAIIGLNGSGKSTLLQIICGILKPTTGTVQVRGKLSALLELGAGFNPEFTGRQNVFINGSILGLTEDEIRSRFDRIESFADIGDFMDQPVKTYSSGMSIRLAFAVAINVDADILVVDEALAVGDIYFQHKCIHRMRELIRKGTTIVFVSHDMGAVRSLFREAILLENGVITRKGKTDAVVDAYYYRMIENEQGGPEGVAGTEETGAAGGEKVPEKDVVFKVNEEFLKRTRDTRSGTGTVRIWNVELLNRDMEPVTRCGFGEWLVVRGYMEFFRDCPRFNVGFIIRDRNGIELIGTNLFVEKIYLSPRKKGDRIAVDFKFQNILKDGTYSITYAVSESDDLGRYNIKTYDWVDNALVFATESPPDRHIHTKVSVPIEIGHHEIGAG